MLFHPADMFFKAVNEAISKEDLDAKLDQPIGETKMTFIVACLQFFGLHPEQSKMEFGREVQKLSLEDKIELWQEMQEVGVECDPPVGYVAQDQKAA